MDERVPDARSEAAREWGRALLATAPWSTVNDRVTLLLVDPPPGLEGAPETTDTAFWLTIDLPTGRSLPAPYGADLANDRAVVERHRLPEGATAEVSVLSDEALHRLLQGVARPSMEARWLARHHEVVADRMRRGEQYALRAGLLSEEAPERIVRGLFLDLVAATRGLTPLTVDRSASVAAAGEAVASLTRLACFDDGGAYPPAPYLRTAAAGTRIGRRLGVWLDDVGAALAGDEAAARRTLSSRDQVVEEVRIVLGERYRDRPWLRTPEAYALRTPR